MSSTERTAKGATSLERRLWAVVDAAVLLGDETTLDGVLQRLVTAAGELTDARFAALAVFDAEPGRLERLVTWGIDEETHRQIGEVPALRGVLGRLIQDTLPLRIDDVSADPAAVGFPEGHPPMTTLLGVPLIVAGDPFGQLYLSDRRDGAPFSDEDEAIVVALTHLAAATVVNQRLIAAARAWADQLEALREVSDSVVAGVGTSELHQLIVRHFRALLRADGATLGLAEPGGATRIVAAEGTGAAFMLEHNPPLPPRLSTALAAGQCVRLDSMSDEPGVEPLAVHEVGAGACVLAPLMSDGLLVGVLGALDRNGGGRFSDADQRMAEVFAHRTAIALELSERVARSSVQALEQAQDSERRRLGRELHDQTGQELTAALLSLRRVATLVGEDQDEARREIAAVRELIAGAMVGVRGLSAMLAPPAFGDGGLAEALESLAIAMEERTGLTIRVETDGTEVPDEMAATLYRMAQESITNAVRHADATNVTVRLSSEPARMVHLSVSDDGRGLEPGAAFGVGLSGMRERARMARGSMTVSTGPEGGAQVAIELPLR